MSTQQERWVHLCGREKIGTPPLVISLSIFENICLQFTYTTVFGVYSAYLFVRTGHLASCVAVHAFCNYMVRITVHSLCQHWPRPKKCHYVIWESFGFQGFPDFSEVLTHREPSKRLALSAAYVAGLAAFFFLLNPMTEPSLYSNQVFQWSTWPHLWRFNPSDC